MIPSKILVVDDEMELQRLIQKKFRKLIQSNEMEFSFALNGEQALNKLKKDKDIDMVLTDINMPEIDGFTLLHTLPQISETLKAVVISAHDDMFRIRQAMNEGAFDFLTKPIDFMDLERTIRKTLEFVNQLKDKQRKIQMFQEQLSQAAFHDALTGLPNRMWLYNHLEHVLRQRKNLSAVTLALLFIDLDGFKKVNDNFGHFAGDLLLKSASKRLHSCLREGDFIARLGGDEFVILLEGVTDATVAVAVAERIRETLTIPFLLGTHEVIIDASIGIALGNGQYHYPEEFLKEADMAMYAAKAKGKGCHVVHNGTKILDLKIVSNKSRKD